MREAIRKYRSYVRRSREKFKQDTAKTPGCSAKTPKRYLPLLQQHGFSWKDPSEFPSDYHSLQVSFRVIDNPAH